MRSELRSASAVVTTTPEAARRIRAAFPELADRPVVSIPNGFDSSDFAEPVQERNDGKFRIVHAGYLHTELGQLQRRVWLLHRLLGGEIEGVDILTRSHVYLLQAIEWLLGRRPALRSVIELHLAGVTSIADREMSERPFVTVHGYVAHGEAIDLMRSADLLFLPMQNTQPGRRSATVPGKTYEYLASQRPILAAVPEGDTRDLLVEAGNALVCIPDDVPAMAAALELQIDRWLRGEPSPTVAPELLERFERRRIAAEMAALFDSLLEGRTVSAPRERSSALSVV
jgi:glycosyltransferase involved in cell wall biosynthesis